jgi:hypothetical protein
MTIEWVFAVAVVLILLHQIRVLRRLSLFADEALANRIIEAGRLKSAETRIELYERENRHMCLTPGCRNPVVGIWIFAHCEQHLERYEKQWLAEKLESQDVSSPPNDEEHSIVKQAQKAIEARRKELAQQNASSKMQALADARDLLNGVRVHKLERIAYLPSKLQARIEQAEKEQQRAIGGNWVPPNLVELINQEAETDRRSPR